jgi:hypothetical protein
MRVSALGLASLARRLRAATSCSPLCAGPRSATRGQARFLARLMPQARGPPDPRRAALPMRTRKTGLQPGLSDPAVHKHLHMKVDRILPGLRTDAKPVSGACVPLRSAKSIARTVTGGTGDGLQPVTHRRSPTNESAQVNAAARVATMSYRAIAAALALADVSVGERLTAFSLASYANRAQLAWPAARTVAARAGLSRRQYLTTRARLADRGLIVLEPAPGGPTQSVVMRLCFAEHGPSIEREVNADLLRVGPGPQLGARRSAGATRRARRDGEL